MSPYINIHTHHPGNAPDEFTVVSYRSGEVPASKYFTFGPHPWWLSETDIDAQISSLRETVNSSGCIGIGESGLDKVCNTSWQLQIKAFEGAINTAESAEKPLIIHCVRAFQELFVLKKRMSPAQSWIIHGFNKNESLARQALQAGCFLSFGDSVVAGHAKTIEALRFCPENMIFLETDMANTDIKAIYSAAAAIKGCTVTALRQQIARNFERVFKFAP